MKKFSATRDSFVEPETLLPSLKAGDLIEFERGKYRHWAMYYDNGYVINISAEDKSKTKAEITLQKLVEVANSVPSKRLVRVNNKEKSAIKNNLKARPVEDSLREAKSMVGTFVPYNFLGTNCEYYCTKWKYGIGLCDQVI